MAGESRVKEQNPRIIYADIIDLPHHQSSSHPHMSLYDRAAQFAPFSALSGYDEMIKEEARPADSFVPLEDSEVDRINQKLSLIYNEIDKGHHPTLSITYFVPDEKKETGKYVTATETIKRIDAVNQKIEIMRTSDTGHANLTISIGMISDIHGELVDLE